jgi:hypothetical protein
MVRHLVDTHPDKFEGFRLRAAYEKGKYVAYEGMKKDNEKFTAYCCLGCNKFFHNTTKCETHFDKCPNKQKHKDKCKELYDAKKAAGGGAAGGEATAPVNEVAVAATKETMAELERLRKEVARLKDNQQNQTEVNEIAAELLKVKKANETYRKKIEEMGDVAKLHREMKNLQYDLEDAKSYEYRYNRLRYMLLIGQTRSDYGRIVPILPIDHRRKLITALESDRILPTHADGLDSDWYDELLFDESDPTPEIVNKVHPMPDYEAKAREEDEGEEQNADDSEE